MRDVGQRGRVIVFYLRGRQAPPRIIFDWVRHHPSTRSTVGSWIQTTHRVATTYFRQLIDAISTDLKSIPATPPKNRTYPLVAERFRMIEAVRNRHHHELRHGRGTSPRVPLTRRTLRGTGRARFLLRQLQPYTVSLTTHVANCYRAKGFISEDLHSIGEFGMDGMIRFAALWLTLAKPLSFSIFDPRQFQCMLVSSPAHCV